MAESLHKQAEGIKQKTNSLVSVQRLTCFIETSLWTCFLIFLGVPPKKIGWGCVARFQTPLPYLRPKYAFSLPYS